MIKEEELYRLVGFITIIILFVLFICKFFNSNKIVEGLTNQKNPLKIDKDLFTNLDKHLKETNDRLADSLLIKKYKTQYEDIIIELDNNTDLNIVKLTSMYGNALVSGNDKDAAIFLQQINELQNFKNSLKNTMKQIDKH